MRPCCQITSQKLSGKSTDRLLEALLADDGGATLSSETSERLLKAGLNLIQRTNEVRWRLIVGP